MSCRCKELEKGEVDTSKDNIVLVLTEEEKDGNCPGKCLRCGKDGKQISIKFRWIEGWIVDMDLMNYHWCTDEKTYIKYDLMFTEYEYVKKIFESKGIKVGEYNYAECRIMQLILYSYTKYIQHFHSYIFADVREAIVQLCLDERNEVEQYEKYMFKHELYEKDIEKIKSRLEGREQVDKINKILLARKECNWKVYEEMEQMSQLEYGPLAINLEKSSKFIWYSKIEETELVSKINFKKNENQIILEILEFQIQKIASVYDIVYQQYLENPKYLPGIQNMVEFFNTRPEVAYELLKQLILDIEKSKELNLWGIGFVKRFKSVIKDDFIILQNIDETNYEKLLQNLKKRLRKIKGKKL